MRRYRMRRTSRTIAGIAMAVFCLTVSSALAAHAETPQQRYDTARRLMQQGKFDAAAEAFRAVADTDDPPASLRAQALVASGLMHENQREYERAADDYREVQRRF